MLVEVTLSDSTIRLFRDENLESYTLVDGEGKCHVLTVASPSVVVDLDDESMILYEEQINTYREKTLSLSKVEELEEAEVVD